MKPDRAKQTRRPNQKHNASARHLLPCTGEGGARKHYVFDWDGEFASRDPVSTIRHRQKDHRRGAGFRSPGDICADAITVHGRLMVTVLGCRAEFERDLIRRRTGEGRERAKARGQHMGRPPKLTRHQRVEAIQRRDKGAETLAEISRSYNVSPQTIGRLA